MLIWLRRWNDWWVYYKKYLILDISNFFFFFFVSCLVVFFDNYVIGVSQAVARKVFLEHFSGLAFRLLCYIMYRKCTCSRVFLLTFSMDWMMFLKTFYVSRKRLFVRDCLLFRILYLSRAPNGLEILNLQFIPTNKV